MTHNFIQFLTTYPFWVSMVFGLLIGSFLNVCIFRIPEETFFSSNRSKCRDCGELIPWWLNVPVFSFLFLRGKSWCCKKNISFQYPIVEVIAACLFAFSYFRYPFAVEPNIVSYPDLIRFMHFTIFSCVLLVCSVIDMRHMIIPDKISLPMIALSPLVAYIHPELSLKSSLLGSFGGAAIIYGIAWGYYLIRRQEGIGMGDAKLLSAIGGWLGVESILPTVLYGSILGSFYGLLAMLVLRKLSFKSEIPFGPFLALGAMVHFTGSFHVEEFFALFGPNVESTP